MLQCTISQVIHKAKAKLKFMSHNSHNILLSTQNINLILSNKTILENISLSLQKGKILTIVGPNGGGKSCLIKILVGLLEPSSGILYRQSNLCIGYTPQRFQIDATLPLSVERFLTLIPNPPWHSKSMRETSLKHILEEVGVPQVLNQSIATLSGGELQRVLLARALLRKPELLVLDEPAQGVDLAGQDELYRLIVKIRNTRQCGIVLVSHDLSLVMAETDVVLCLNQHVCCSGPPEAVSRDPQFLGLFGLEAGSFALYTHRHDHDHK